MSLIEKGALAQLTDGSYVGSFGNEIQKLSKQLIDAALVYFVASDAYNTALKCFYMKEAYQQLGKEFGKKSRRVSENDERYR